ncbi:MAG: hypothetical protein WC310_05860 [Patescibacteria group bacterium]|jgi:hypothetical protein
MIEKFRKFIDKYFCYIYITLILAIAFFCFSMVKMVMAQTCEIGNCDLCLNQNDCETAGCVWNSTCQEPTPTPTATPEATDEPFVVDQNYIIEFNGTTTPFVFSNTWTAPDILMVGGLYFLIIFLVGKAILSGVIRAYVSIRRKFQ